MFALLTIAAVALVSCIVSDSLADIVSGGSPRIVPRRKPSKTWAMADTAADFDGWAFA